MSSSFELPVPGAIIGGRYQIVRALGSGGMGVVFEAVHQRLRQSVAIKIIRPEMARSQELLIRFEREARAAARLRSPNVVRIFDVDTTADGLTYMIMELLVGNDLQEEVARTPAISAGVLSGVVVQCCAAMSEAHGKGIVHRDLKPANIFLATEGSSRIAKILDFGISKFLGDTTSNGSDMASVATSGGIIGTPEYMAPEQIRVGGKVDHRTDIWALGMVLYRVLSKRSPFSGTSSTEHMLSILADPLLSFEAARPDLPMELAAVVMKALEKDPDDRYQDAASLARALSPFVAEAPPISVPIPPSLSASVPRSRSAIIDLSLSDTVRAASPFADSEATRDDRRPPRAAAHSEPIQVPVVMKAPAMSITSPRSSPPTPPVTVSRKKRGGLTVTMAILLATAAVVAIATIAAFVGARLAR